MKQTALNTPLGLMVAVADKEVLRLLEFADCIVERHTFVMRQAQCDETTEPLKLIKHELEQYFTGKLEKFETPMLMIGNGFQKSVWKELEHIPLGEIRSYTDIAKIIGKSSFYEEVAITADVSNFAIIIPSHRAVTSSEDIGKYSGGLDRKRWLIIHEVGIALLRLKELSE